MTTPTSATAQIKNLSNPINKAALLQVKAALFDSISVIKLLKSTTSITNGKPLQLDHMKLQGFSVITTGLINNLEITRLLVDENPNADGSEELEALIFETIAIFSFIQMFQTSEEQLYCLNEVELLGL